MKHVAKGLFVLALLIVLATPAYAETLSVEAKSDVLIEVTPAPKSRFLQRLPLMQDRMAKREERREEHQEKKEIRLDARAEMMTERKEDRQEKMANHWREFAKRHYERMKRRHAEYIERFTNLITRLQKNIDEKKTAGKNVAEAQAKLNESKQLLTEAQTQSTKTLQNLEKLSTVASVDAQLNVQALQDAQASGKAFLKVQAALREVVKMLKELV